MSKRQTERAISSADSQRAIEDAASQWLVRLDESAHADEDQEAFEVWLAIDPAHGEAFDALSRTWEDVNQLKQLKPLADPSPKPTVLERITRGFGELWARPGVLSGGLVAAVAAAVAFVFVPPMLVRPDAAYETPIAETRDVRLPDGSVVTLGARSEIETYFTDTERRVRLVNGEAFFDVVHNESLPFVVEAGDTLIRDIGTKFNVNRGDDRVGVSVLEGIVEISERGGPLRRAARDVLLLHAGERMDVEHRPLLSLASAATTPPQTIQTSSVAAWRAGRLSYDDAPLSQLVADVNRYYAPGVRLASPEVGAVRVTASFRTNEIPQFLDALGSALPVEVEQSHDGAFALRDRRADAR